MAIIIISRGTFSGVKILVEKLEKKLNYKSVSREIIIEASRKYGISEQKLFNAIQKSPGFFSRLTYERDQYLTFIKAVLLDFVREDNVIYHGHAGHFFLSGLPNVLRIRIIAPIEYRIKAIQEQLEFSRRDAIKYIHNVDKERIKWTKFLYQRDWRNPELYDMVINLENIDITLVTEIIKHTIEQEKFKTTPEVKQKLNDMFLKSRIMVLIANSEHITCSEIDVFVEKGKAILTGKVKNEDILPELIKKIKALDGIEDVVNESKIDYRYQDIDK